MTSTSQPSRAARLWAMRTAGPVPGAILIAVGVFLWALAFRDADRTFPDEFQRAYVEQYEAPAMTWRGFGLFAVGSFLGAVGALWLIYWRVDQTMPRYLEQRRREREAIVAEHDSDTAAQVRARRAQLDELEERVRQQQSLAALSDGQVAAIRDLFSKELADHEERTWTQRTTELVKGGAVAWAMSGLLGFMGGQLISFF